mgnify:CR=1 FL=1
MVIWISIMVIILYICIEYLYKRYKENNNDNEKQSLHMQIRISDLERKNMINEEMINWLCDEVANYKLKEGKKK